MEVQFGRPGGGPGQMAGILWIPALGCFGLGALILYDVRWLQWSVAGVFILLGLLLLLAISKLKKLGSMGLGGMGPMSGPGGFGPFGPGGGPGKPPLG